ncbi:MAG TPA: T9SS type A sorting domain-containing protein, partial [Puia sp.]|nr:T9SS type A sorting domain-containing protein [Puia sp.]
SGSYSLSYRINGGSIVTESSSAVIAPNTEYYYPFTNTCDLSAAGAYSLQAWVTYPGDPAAANDTFSTVIRHLQNDPIALSPTYTEGFESATAQTRRTAVLGLEGLDRGDFSTSNSNGRMRTFINTGMARTGNRCATLDQSNYSTSFSADSLITTFNLSNYSAGDQIWLDFYFQNQGIDFNLPGNQVWIRGNESAAWIPVYTLDTDPNRIGVYQPSPHINISGILAGATPSQMISSSFQVKFGEQGFTSTNSVIPDGDLDDGYSFDDITLTKAVNDISATAVLPPDLTSTCNLSAAETIRLKVKNYSPLAATNVPVSYSVNGLVVTEFIPLINGNDSVTYTFTQKADLSAYRSYTLTGWSKYPGDNYPGDDTTVATNFQTTPVISTFPYLEGFENDNGYWYAGGINSSWEWGTPVKTIINKAANGAKCWTTSLNGGYNNSELSYLYSPCFDLSGLSSPVLSFSHIFQTEDACDCDYHWVEYSTDGVTWTKLGIVGNGTNWYDNWARVAWQASNKSWHVSSYTIPSNGNKVRFRIVMNSDPATTLEGIGIDDIHIFDKAPVYSGADVSSGLAQSVSGTDWIHFDQGGGRVVSINPNGQDLGNTRVEVYINPGPVRNDGHQYYLDRNIVIRPANPPTGAVSVRYYFLASEADSLIHAVGCGTCTTIADAYQAGVMQYSSPVAVEEDSVLRNDSSGTFHFLSPHRDLSIIPYDKGYYAEYSVTGFSEFWINNGDPGKDQPYPLALLSFTVARSAGGGLLQWGTKEEWYTSRYVIQKSSDGINFFNIDSVKAVGDSGTVDNYRYTDYHLFNGVNYYRLKITGLDRSFKYSVVRSISDTISRLVVSLYPNPVRTGILQISTSVNCTSIQLTDVSGRVLQTMATHGFLNTLYLRNIARGIYFVRVRTEGGEKVQKILVN